MKNSKIALGFVLITMLGSCNSGTEKVEESTVIVEEVQYSCPMQCEGDLTHDEAGECPVCGMDLVAVHDEHQEE